MEDFISRQISARTKRHLVQILDLQSPFLGATPVPNASISRPRVNCLHTNPRKPPGVPSYRPLENTLDMVVVTSGLLEIRPLAVRSWNLCRGHSSIPSKH